MDEGKLCQIHTKGVYCSRISCSYCFMSRPPNNACLTFAVWRRLLSAVLAAAHPGPGSSQTANRRPAPDELWGGQAYGKFLQHTAIYSNLETRAGTQSNRKLLSD